MGRSNEASELLKVKLISVTIKLSHVYLALSVVDSLSGISEESDDITGVHVSLVSTVLSVERLESDNTSLSGSGLSMMRRSDRGTTGDVVGVMYWGSVGSIAVMVDWSSVGSIAVMVDWSSMGSIAVMVDWSTTGNVMFWRTTSNMLSWGLSLDVSLELSERDGARVISVVISEGSLEVSVRKVNVLSVEESSEFRSVHLVVAVSIACAE